LSGFYEPPPAFSSPYRARLHAPKWDVIQSHLGRPVPQVLHALYDAPDDAVTRSHFRLFPPDGGPERWLDLFLPMDEEAVAPDGARLPPGTLAFADDEHGDHYVFVPDASVEGVGPVFLRSQRPGAAAMVPVAPSLTGFLAWERRQCD
jgi:hypothetical protein